MNFKITVEIDETVFEKMLLPNGGKITSIQIEDKPTKRRGRPPKSEKEVTPKKRASRSKTQES